MKTINVNVFTLDELDKEVQDKIIEQHRYDEVEYSKWYQPIYDNVKEKLEEVGFINSEMEFSGFGSQGDGASFTSDVDVLKLAKSLNYDKDALKILKRLVDNDELKITVRRNSNQYSHKYTCSFDIDCDDYEDKYTVAIIEGLEKQGEELRLDLCTTLYDDLQNEYEYLTSDLSIKEMLLGNDYHYTEDGKLM